MPIHALNTTARAADSNLDGLTHHAVHGSNHLAVLNTDRIEEHGATPSIGIVGDSFDNALTEAVDGIEQTWRTRRRGSSTFALNGHPA